MLNIGTTFDASVDLNSEHIRFSQPYSCGTEIAFMQDAMARNHLCGDGFYTSQCQLKLQQVTSSKKALLTTSCTDALEIAAALLNLAPGDEVIVPSFTFVSTANAFFIRGAKIVFGDIRNDTLNLDESKLAQLISKRTKAIVPVHYGGTGCEMETIMDIAAHYDVQIIEDNAHGLFGSYKGQSLGAFGQSAALSFHQTKNIQCGEGGALLINDERLIERAEVIREKGTNRSRFFRGEVDRYTWVDIGSSHLPSELLAAYLWGQLNHAEFIQAERKRIWELYSSELKYWAEGEGVQLPSVPQHCSQPYHHFALVMPSSRARERFIERMMSRNILVVHHYLPLHLSDMGRLNDGRAGLCPVAESVSERLVRLPLFVGMTEQQIERVITEAKRSN